MAFTFQLTVDKLRKVWNNVKRTYKDIMDHYGGTGRNRRTWALLENVEEILEDTRPLTQFMLTTHCKSVRMHNIVSWLWVFVRYKDILNKWYWTSAY